MRIKRIVVFILFLSCLLSAFGFAPLTAEAAAAPQAEETAPEPEPTPAPTTPVDYRITDESPEEILALAERSELRHIDAVGCTEYQALLELSRLLPDCEIDWEVEFQGVSCPSDTETLTVTDLTGLETVLPLLPALKQVDLLAVRVRFEDIDRFREIRPDVFYLFQFWLDGHLIRTDTRVYSSLLGIELRGRDLSYYDPVLRYCPYLKALDLGHNGITDITRIGEMTDLEVLILADNMITDLSPLGNLTNLVVLELFLTHDAEDFSFLNKLTKLKDLNLCYCPKLDTLDFMEYMPDLSFLMVKRTAVSQEDFDAWKERRPEVRMVLFDGDPESTGSGWRMTGRNRMIRIAFSEYPFIVRYESYNDYDLRINGGVHPITDFYDENENWC